MTIRRLSRCAAAACVLALLSAPRPLFAAEVTGLSVPEAAKTITAEELKTHLTFLAGDELKGRDSGSEGCRKAAEYIAKEFTACGLKPFGDKGEGAERSYFQSLSISGAAKLTGSGNGLSLKIGDKALAFKPGQDYLPLSLSANTAVKDRELAFVGYGITDAESGYDDYVWVKAKGRVVVMLRYEHSESSARIYQPSRHAWLVTKVENAVRHGAAGLILVNGPNSRHAGTGDPLIGLGNVGRLGRRTIPVVQAKRAILDKLLEGRDEPLPELQKRLDKTRQAVSFVLTGKTVSLGVSLETPMQRTENVVAVLEGSDPELKHEHIVIGAHYDHIGLGHYASRWRARGRGKIHNGADDNGSGTVGVLEIAEALASLRVRPRRSVLFVLFSGEERGLIGSRYFVAHPPVPLSQMVTMINLDMIGRSRKGGWVSIAGVGTCPVFKRTIALQNLGLKLDIHTSDSGWRPSDNVSFLGKRIPVLFYFTGLHKQYHTPEDDVERINFTDQERIVQHAMLTAAALSDRGGAIRYVEVKRPAGRIRLGIYPDMDQVPAVVVEHVMGRSPAQRAGIMKGDRIVELNGKKIATIDDLRHRLVDQVRGKKVPIKVQRKASDGTVRTVELTVQF